MATLGKSLVEVGISMVLRDNFTAEAGRISKSYISLMNDLNQYNRALSNGVGTAFDTGIRMTQGIISAYKHYAEVNNQVFMTSKIAGASAAQQLDIMNKVKEVNRLTPLTNMDIASGTRYLAMAGNSAEAIQNMIDPAAKLASIFDMNLGGKGGVADMMTNIMATFNIASTEAKRVADILGVATTSANISLTDLAQSLQYSGATFRNAGVDLSTAAAAIGVLGDQGIQASSAGTALANMLRYLTLSITGQKTNGTKMLHALGLSKEDFTDAYGNLKRLDVIMKTLHSRISGLSGTDKETVMYNIFGVRGERAVSALLQALGNGSDKMNEIMQREAMADGWVDNLINEKRSTAQGRIDTFRASIENLTMTLGSLTSGPFNLFIKYMSNLVNVMDKVFNNSVGGFLVQFSAMAVISATIVNGFRLLRNTFTMINGLAQVFSTNTTKAATAMGTTVAGAKVLEGELRTIVALMGTLVGFNMQAGNSLLLPFGGKLTKSAAGNISMTYPGFKGHPGPGGGATNLAAMLAMSSVAGNTAGNAASNAARGASQAVGFGSRLKKVAGMGFGLMGGWWGLALTGISVGLPYLIEAINGNKDATDENTQAVKSNTLGMTAQQFQQYYQGKFMAALQEAMNGGKGKQKLNITVNGLDAGAFGDNDTLNLNNLYGI
jgi:TP901 family phage tail tape measure protein